MEILILSKLYIEFAYSDWIENTVYFLEKHLPNKLKDYKLSESAI